MTEGQPAAEVEIVFQINVLNFLQILILVYKCKNPVNGKTAYVKLVYLTAKRFAVQLISVVQGRHLPV